MTAPLIALGAFNEMATANPIKPAARPAAAKTIKSPTGDTRTLADYQHARDLVVADEARRSGVNPHLALAVARTENEAGTPWTIGPTGDVGLMQVNARANKLNVDDLQNPRTNAREGTRILRTFIHRYGDIDTALRAYNGSLRNKAKGDAYVAKVKAHMKDLVGNDALTTDIRGLTPSDSPQPPDAFVQAVRDYEDVAFSGRFTPEMIAQEKQRFEALTNHLVARRTRANEQASRRLPARTQASRRPEDKVASSGGASAQP